MNATRLGFTPLEGLFFSCIIYAGASQFVITAMPPQAARSGGGPHRDGDGCVTFCTALRSVAAFIARWINENRALGFGLTDEVFAAATASWFATTAAGAKLDARHRLHLRISWVFGTLIGAYSGSGLLVGFPAVEAALSFMLPALFMSFLLASFQRKQSLCDGSPGGCAGRHYSVLYSSGHPRRDCLAAVWPR
ncbi:hypothetical protein DMH17_00925 [Raoultella planticola]|nr:hypothetical protein [Raoultella planticola]